MTAVIYILHSLPSNKVNNWIRNCVQTIVWPCPLHKLIWKFSIADQMLTINKKLRYIVKMYVHIWCNIVLVSKRFWYRIAVKMKWAFLCFYVSYLHLTRDTNKSRFVFYLVAFVSCWRKEKESEREKAASRQSARFTMWWYNSRRLSVSGASYM